MHNVDALMREQLKKQNPGHELGRFLLSHTNSPEYLVSQLEAYLAASRADLEKEQAMFRMLTKTWDE